MLKTLLKRIKRKKESVDIKNEAESFIYTTEKLVNQDLKDKIPQEKGIQITDAIKELKDSLSQDPEQIKQKLEALKTIVNEITTELYKNASPPPGEQPSDDSKQPSDDSKQPSDDSKQPSDDSKQPSDDSKQPSDDSKQPSDDSNSEQKSENTSS